MKTRKIIIISFTETGSNVNRELCRQLSKRGYACESYAVKRFAQNNPTMAEFCKNIKETEDKATKEVWLQPLPENLKEWIGTRWGTVDFLFIGAAGIAVRLIAPWVKEKLTDSAVLVMDERAQYVIPLLSGHMGGAVAKAKQIADCMGAEPVITTATDVQGVFAVDVFARENGLLLTNRSLAKQISAAVLERKQIGFYSAWPLHEKTSVPAELVLCKSLEELERFEYAVAVTPGSMVDRKEMPGNMSDRKETRGNMTDRKEMSGEARTPDGEKVYEHILYLHPRNLILGIGCRKGISCRELKKEVELILKRAGLSVRFISAIASIDLKKEEEGLHELAKEYGIPFVTFSAEELKKVPCVSSSSAFVESVTGVDNVCERAALCDCPQGKLVLEKTKGQKMTAAVVEAPVRIHFQGETS